MTVLIDSNFLIALNVIADKNHQAAVQLATTYKGDSKIPELAISEVFHLVLKRVSYQEALKAIQGVSKMPIERVCLQSEDYIRVSEIMRQYESAKFDLVDTAIMALSERMNITTIFTFDRRDFSIFRPKHTTNLTLLP